MDLLVIDDSTSAPRDLIEYKRELNKATSFVDRRMNTFVCDKLDRIVSNDGRYHDYLAPEARAKLLSDVAPGDARLTETFGMTAFPVRFESGTWTPYPGLSDDRAKDLRERHDTIKRSAAYRIEHLSALMRQSIRRLRTRFPSSASVPGVARRARY